MKTGRQRNAGCCLVLSTVLVVCTLPAAAMVLDSSSALYDGGLFMFSDPPSPASGVVGTRQINGFGTVSSSIQHDLVADGNGPFSYDAHSAISVNPGTGISFGGFASVNSVAAFSGLDGRAHTEGAFADDLLISAPGQNDTLAFLAIPLHVTGAVGTLGADNNSPFAFTHSGQLSYQFATGNGCGFNRLPCPRGSVGFSTPGETIPGPVALDQTFTVKVPFILGEDTFLSAVFGVDADLGVPFDTTPGAAAPASRVVADFSHTLTAGPATVVDGAGNVIQNAVVLSDFNYLAGPAAPPPSLPPPSPPPPAGVPEPGTDLLLMAGLMAWAARPRHRESRRAAAG